MKAIIAMMALALNACGGGSGSSDAPSSSYADYGNAHALCSSIGDANECYAILAATVADYPNLTYAEFCGTLGITCAWETQ